ncbi:reverse transcriptase family protein [Undibacterium sp. TJN19]|uniref:reverse transcriptase family protein n=1 Tax=Undibacterium sp. TJN19 TaxID=3413055 RepID=UPI003BEFF153
MTQNAQPASTTPPLSQMTRDELYAHLRTTTKDAVVMREMQRLGFWPAQSDKPGVAEELIEREATLTASLGELSRQLERVQDPKAALRDMRKQRMVAAKERREQTRQKHAQLRYAKAVAWQQKRREDIVYLGEEVSSGLNYSSSDLDKLARLQLPVLQKAPELATAIGIPLAELRFMTFQRKVSAISHYQRFAISKKTGGQRIISAPMPRLKRCQYWVLDHILNKLPCHPAAHGFLPQHSIVSNATPHVGQAVVINLDLKDFFPSISYQRVKGVFASLGYSQQIATLLGLLCTEQASEEVRVDTQKYFVAGKQRSLPQGAPSSPMISNILCISLDKRLHAAAAKLGFQYTRYADDLTFSTSQKERPPVGKLLWRVKQIIAAEGFTPHPDKQRIMRHSQKQEVTGIVVNQTPTIDAKTLHRFRATLHQVEKHGPAGAHWNGNTNVLSALEGYARYICMVNPAKGQPWLARIKALRAAQASPAQVQVSKMASAASLRQQVAAGQTPLRANGQRWWQVQEPAAPVLEQTAQQMAEAKQAIRDAKKEAAAPKKQQRAAARTTYAAPGATPSSHQPDTGRSGRASTPAPTSAPHQDHKPRPIVWWLILLQLFVSMWVSIHVNNVGPMTFGLIVLAISVLTRRNLLLLFTVIMLVCLLIP